MRRRRLKPDDRRAEIVEAATAVFVDQPYSSISIAEIAKKAGASRALVTHYFTDKETLYTAVLTNFILNARETVRTDRDLPREETIRANLESVLEFAEKNRDTVVALFRGGPIGQDPTVTMAVENLRDQLIDRVLINNFGTSDVKPEVRLAVQGFTGLAGSMIVGWLDEQSVSRDRVAEMLIEMLDATMKIGA